MDYLWSLAQQFIRYITADKDTLYIFSPLNIGDFLINGGFCHALLKKKHKKACVLIVNEKFAKSGTINFVGVKEIQYMPKLLMDFIRQYVRETREYETDNFIYGHFKVEKNFYILNTNLCFVDQWKEDVFDLPLNTELIPPIIEPPTDYQEQRLHEAYTLDRERTIILAPYANTVPNLEETFWEKLASELKKKNKDYVFYTNVAAPNEKVIPGTAPIITDFSELMYIADKVKCFIGLRSGIFDLLAFTNARLLYVMRSSAKWYYDLRLNYNHTNNKAFYLASPPEKERLTSFMQENNIDSFDEGHFYGHVPARDFALDVDSLLERIINEVD